MPRSGPIEYSTTPELSPLLPAMTGLEWAMLVGLLLVYELASMRPIFTANRAAGIPLASWHPFALAAVDGTLWLSLLPAIYGSFDRTLYRPGHSGRHAAARVAIAVVAMAVQAATFCGVLLAVGSFTDLGVPARTSPLLGFPYEFETNVPPILLLSLAYAVLMRVHAVRRQHRLAFALQLSLAEARLHALSIELQPHFLFNTLNAIAALVRDDPETAEAMLIGLSDLLRLTLGTGQAGETSLASEMERLDLYLRIQQMRFGPRLSVRQHVDLDAAGAAVPSLLLQPLVENALTHGLGPRRGPGVLEITCRRQAEWLVVSVRDDGVGLPPEGVRQERVGIGNTRARLAAMFGDAHQLDLSPVPTGGTLVTATMPYRVAGAQAMAPTLGPA